MKQHEYQITVKHIADAKGNPSTYDDDLIFTAYNHDDIFKIWWCFKKYADIK